MTRSAAHAVAFSPLTGRDARVGSLADQRASTWEAISAAITTRGRQAALELVEFALRGECRFIYELLDGWARDLRGALGDHGVPEGRLEAIEAGLAALLAFPDGRPYEAAVGWSRLEASVAALRELVERGDWERAADAVPRACEAWRVLHDRVVDRSYGWMSAWVEQFGEASIPEMFETIGREHFEEFLELGHPDRHAWTQGGYEAVALDTLEAMRAHLSTVNRDGAPIQMVEHDDRYEFEFDPCGSGGRALRGDLVEGTPSRIEEPYRFGVIDGAYDWTDGRAGMCVYCNHCQQLYEQWTIDRVGIPFLVVDPPTVADGVGHDSPKHCRYTIYKTPEAVPDEIFARCGRSRVA